MILEIPIAADRPHFSFDVDLEGSTYRIALDWNAREGAWYLQLADEAGTPLRSGIRLVPNWPLLRKLRHAQRPPGELMLVAERDVEITEANLGVDVVLLYAELADVAGAGV